MSVGEVQRRNFFSWLLLEAATLLGVPLVGSILLVVGITGEAALLIVFGSILIGVGIVASIVVLLVYSYLRAQDFSIYLSGTEDSILAVSPWWAIVASSVYSLFYSGRFREHLRRQGNPMAERFPDPVIWFFVTTILYILTSIFFLPIVALIIWTIWQEYRLHSTFYDLASPLAA